MGSVSSPLLRSVVFKGRLSQTHHIHEIMKLHSDRGNPFLLRILAAKYLAGVRLTLKYINFEGRSIFQPFLFKSESETGTAVNFRDSIPTEKEEINLGFSF